MKLHCPHCGFFGEPTTHLDFINFKGDRRGKTDSYVCPKCGRHWKGLTSEEWRALQYLRAGNVVYCSPEKLLRIGLGRGTKLEFDTISILKKLSDIKLAKWNRKGYFEAMEGVK